MNRYLTDLQLLNILKPHFQSVGMDPADLHHTLWLEGVPVCRVLPSEGNSIRLSLDGKDGCYAYCYDTSSNMADVTLVPHLRGILSHIEKEREAGRLIWEDALRSF